MATCLLNTLSKRPISFFRAATSRLRCCNIASAATSFNLFNYQQPYSNVGSTYRGQRSSWMPSTGWNAEHEHEWQFKQFILTGILSRSYAFANMTVRFNLGKHRRSPQPGERE